MQLPPNCGEARTRSRQSDQEQSIVNHSIFEKNSIILLIGILIVVSIGGIVQIAPLFFLNSTIEKVSGMRPYSPLELAGRDIYIREGCYNCHSQMIRSLRDEVERYGHYSLAAESMYDHPFQWGSKRTGPDLARVGGKYSDAWHVDHMRKPKSVVPTSIMPGYPFLETTPLDTKNIEARMTALRMVGVPYTDDMIANAKADVTAQINPDAAGVKDLLERYPKAQVRKFDGQPAGDDVTPSELDAMIAYLQMLGTLVDFTKFDASGPNLR
jgi:cytochrome c oxidase cbb3-type subunit II